MDPFLQQLLAYQQALQQQRKSASSPGYAGYVPNDVYVEDNKEEHEIPGYGRYFDTNARSTRDYPTRSSPFERYFNGNIQYPTPQSYAKKAALGSTHPSYAYFDDNDEYNYQSPFAQPSRPNIIRYVQPKQSINEKNEDAEKVGDDDDDAEDEQPEVDYPSFFSYPIDGLNQGRYGAYKPVRSSSSIFERQGKPVNRSSSFRSGDGEELPFTFKRQRQQPKVKVVKSQPMYIMDRYGNLYPYSPKVEEPVIESKPSKKEIDANDLIKLLLGGGACEEKASKEKNEEANNNEESKEETQEPSEEIEEPSEKVEKSDAPTIEVKETPLTREGLAEILSQISKEEGKKEEPEFVPTPEPIPPLLRKQSTVPLLNVHKTEDETVNSNSSKPIVVEDVKVSAPQLTKTNKPFSPPINIYEFQSQYIVVISLPGVSKEFVDIDYHPTTNELIVKGEAKNKYLSDDDDMANSFILKLSEQRFGNFERIIKIPSYPGIDDTKIKAKFLNGMLEVKLPKIDESSLPKSTKKITLEEIPDEELQRESTKGLI